MRILSNSLGLYNFPVYVNTGPMLKIVIIINDDSYPPVSPLSYVTRITLAPQENVRDRAIRISRHPTDTKQTIFIIK